MEIEALVTICTMIMIVIVKLIKKYMIENNIKKDLIYSIEDKKDKFINKNYKWILGILIVIIAITRLYKFGEIPEYIGCDEAGAAYDAYCLANYGVDRYLNVLPLYFVNFGGGQSVLYAYATIPFIKLFGANIVSYRLPELIFFVMGIIVSYILVSKFKDKKTALLYVFVITICPWHLEASRQGLDCNLLAPMFMLDILLLLNANKNWHYAVAGISIGITLYTYALSWMLIPVFLLFYVVYALYTKKIKFKQIIILGIPILIFAIPLFYLILLNHGYVSETKFGIFTIPKLPLYREGEIKLSNIWNYGERAIYNVFLNKYSLFIFEIPFFVVGLIVGITEFIYSLKNRKFSFTGFITVAFVILYITNLTVAIGTINKINIVYFPLLYIITLGIIKVCDKSYFIPALTLVILSILFMNFEMEYFDTAKRDERDLLHLYESKELFNITEIIESDTNNENINKYFITYRTATSYIYSLLETKIAPYEFYETKNKNLNEVPENEMIVNSFSNYYFFDNVKDSTLEMINNNEKYIVIMDEKYTESIKKLQSNEITISDYGHYKIIKNY